MGQDKRHERRPSTKRRDEQEEGGKAWLYQGYRRWRRRARMWRRRGLHFAAATRPKEASPRCQASQSSSRSSAAKPPPMCGRADNGVRRDNQALTWHGTRQHPRAPVRRWQCAFYPRLAFAAADAARRARGAAPTIGRALCTQKTDSCIIVDAGSLRLSRKSYPRIARSTDKSAQNMHGRRFSELPGALDHKQSGVSIRLWRARSSED